MKEITLGSLCNPSNGQIQMNPEDIIDYIDISSVNNETKSITGYSTMTFAEAPSRARKRIRENSILISMVRPNLNAIAIFEKSTPNTPVASTGFSILDCKDNVDPRFVYHYCKSGKFIGQMTAQATGASYPAVNDGIVRSALLPFYELDEQKRISNLFDRIEAVIQSRKTQLLSLDTLIKARFVEMFGEPISNDKDLPLRKLGEICELQAGDFTPAEDIHELPDENNPYPCYGGNGIRGYVDNYTQEGIFPIIGRQGALCGNVQLACGKFRNTEHAVLVTPRISLNRLWLFELLRLEDLYRFHTGAAQPGLAVKTLNQISVPVAPEEEQKQYADFYAQIDKSKIVVQAALNKAQLLFDNLMQQCFG